MIKEGLDYIRSMALRETTTVSAHGLEYTQQDLSPITPPEFKQPVSVAFETLDGIIEFITENGDHLEMGNGYYAHVGSFSRVSFHGPINPLNFNNRFQFASATMSQKSFQFGHYHGLEDFIISLQSMFAKSETTEKLLNMLGNLANENIIENVDDGLSQTIQIKTSITQKANVKINNPLTLKPFRTFREVDQPESLCILRLKKSGADLTCALFESDGGAWQLAAIKNIKAYLTGKLECIVPVIG